MNNTYHAAGMSALIATILLSTERAWPEGMAVRLVKAEPLSGLNVEGAPHSRSYQQELVDAHLQPGNGIEHPPLRVRLVSDADGRLIWVGPEAAFLAEHHGRVVGVLALHSFVIIPELLHPYGPGEAERLNGAAMQIEADPGLAGGHPDRAIVLEPALAFGLRRLHPTLDSRGVPNPLRQASISADPVGTLSLKAENAVGDRLGLTLDGGFNVMSATVNGDPIPLIRNPRVPPVVSWGGPVPKTASRNGQDIEVMTCAKTVVRPMADGSKETLSLRAALSLDGAIWVGPSDCRLGFIMGDFVGMRISPRKVIEIHRGIAPDPSGRLPDPIDFETLLMQWEDRCRSEGHRPTVEIPLEDLWTDEAARIATTHWSSIVLRRLVCVDGEITASVCLLDSGPDDMLVATFDADFSPVRVGKVGR